MTRNEQDQVNAFLTSVREAEMTGEQRLDLAINILCDLRAGRGDAVFDLVQSIVAVDEMLRPLIIDAESGKD